MDIQTQYNRLIKVSGSINEICRPFFEKHKINYFSYGRLEDNGAFSCLVTNPDWYQNFWEVKHPFTIPGPKDPTKNNYFYLWSEGLSEKVVADALNNFGMANGITLIYKNENHTKYFTFTAEKQNYHAISFYLNNLDIMQSFAGYFLDKAQNLIVTAKKQPLIVPDNTQKLLDINTDLSFGSRVQTENNSNINQNIIEFSQKELDCIQYLRNGFTVKEIAKALFLSPRTIEDRLNFIKDKLGCFRKSQIISRLDATTPILLTD